MTRILSDEEMDALLAAEGALKRRQLAEAGRDAGTLWEPLPDRRRELKGAAVILWLCLLALLSIPGAAVAFVWYYLRR